MKGYDKKKLKFWLIGASTSLLGVLIIRFDILSCLDLKAAFIDIAGYILAFSGLFIITLATRKKAKK